MTGEPEKDSENKVDVHAKLAEIRRLVEDARSMPMSASAVVNRTELLALIDELDGGLSAAFSDADRIVADRQSVVEDGRREAEELLERAHREHDWRMVFLGLDNWGELRAEPRFRALMEQMQLRDPPRVVRTNTPGSPTPPVADRSSR